MHYIIKVENRISFMKKRTVQNLYTSMTEECISITSSLWGCFYIVSTFKKQKKLCFRKRYLAYTSSRSYNK